MANEVKVFRLVDVALHNKSKGEDKSIWTVIHDKVYDITKFLDEVVFSRETTLLFINSSNSASWWRGNPHRKCRLRCN